MLNGERKIARPLRWAMIGGGRTMHYDNSAIGKAWFSAIDAGYMGSQMVRTALAWVFAPSFSG